jgi:hypothetical protein
MKYVNDILWISRVHFKNYTPPAEIDYLNQALYKNQIATNSGEVVKIKEEKNLFHIEINNVFIPANRRYDGYYAVFSNNTNRLAFHLETVSNKFTTFLTTQRYYNNRINMIVAKPDLPIGSFNMQIGKLENGQFKVLKEQVIEIK